MISARLAALAAVLLAAAPARAHHAGSPYGTTWAVPATRVELDTQVASFDLGARRGSWQLVVPSLEYAVHPRLSVALRIPVARVSYEGAGAFSGLGDLQGSVKVGLLGDARSRLALAAGLGLELPTGDRTNGLGTGHVELSPYVALSVTPHERVALFALLADRISLGQDHDPDGGLQGSAIAPHTSHELALLIGAAALLGPVYLSAGSAQTLLFTGPRRLGPVVVLGEVGGNPVSRLRLAVGVDVPVAGEERFSWRLRFGVALTF